MPAAQRKTLCNAATLDVLNPQRSAALSTVNVAAADEPQDHYTATVPAAVSSAGQPALDAYAALPTVGGFAAFFTDAGRTRARPDVRGHALC